jgi:hypothetical protein
MSYPLNNGGTSIYACPNLPNSFPLLDIHATGLTFQQARL